MQNFEFFAPTKVIFGEDTDAMVGGLVAGQGCKKVLIHYGGNSAVKSGLIDRIKTSLAQAGVAFVELGGVVPNPHLSLIREGIELGRREGVDFVLAVGGGSVIDSSKTIAFGLAEPDEDVWELFEHTREAAGCLPVGVILTIAAAGSEMSGGCVVTNEETGKKRSYDNDLCRPRFAVMNPELTMTLPDYQTASGCADMMMHTMERYFCKDGCMEVTDALAESLMRVIMKNALLLHDNPLDYQARAEVMWAGALAHNGLTGCGGDGGDWSAHMMEHELGGMFDVTHGAGLAAIWPSWARYVYLDCLPRFVRFALNVMEVEPGASDAETAMRGIQKVELFYHKIGMPVNLRELGIEPTDEQIAAMARSCAAACGGSQGSARVLYEQDMAEIYKMAR